MRGQRFDCTAVLLNALVATATPNLRPIIGILANGPNDTSLLPPYTSHDAYIAASYVKHIEAAGARVVPIPWYLPAARVRELARQLNGFLLPGGGVHFFRDGALSPYGATTRILYDETVSAWASGETLPLWGTCLGHEMILTHAAGDDPNLDEGGFVSENVSMPLLLTDAGRASRLWGSAPAEVLDALQYNVTMNLHTFGITPAAFAASPAAAVLNVLSIGADANGKPFVSSTEGKDNLPIFTTQFHPEKATFEYWWTENVNHTYASIVANQWTARFFVQQARMNARRFDTPKAEYDALIFNYEAEYTQSIMQGYVQTYFFDAA